MKSGNTHYFSTPSWACEFSIADRHFLAWISITLTGQNFTTTTSYPAVAAEYQLVVLLIAIPGNGIAILDK